MLHSPIAVSALSALLNAQCSVMNEYAEDLHGNDILDIETKKF